MKIYCIEQPNDFIETELRDKDDADDTPNILITAYQEDIEEVHICLNTARVAELISSLTKMLPKLKEAELRYLLVKGADDGPNV